MKNIILDKANICINCKNTPCKFGCPLGNDIPKFIHYVKEKNYEKAFFILSKTTILPAICGLICPQSLQCEKMCEKILGDNHVNIGKLEAFIGKYAIEHNYKIYSPKKTHHHVLVIGSGPASLTCAAFLRRNGIKVTIYEKHDYLGGLLIHGIPDFRLSKKLVNKVINNIINLGIEISYNKELGKDFNIEDVVNQYDAIFIGIGSNISNNLNIIGEELKNVYSADELLEENMNLDVANKKVIVYGGGNTAIDIARTLKKLGANVTIIYRKDKKHLSAFKDEYEDCVNDKIKFIFKTNVLNIIGKDKVEKLEVVKTKLEKVDGKEILQNIDNSNYFINCDYFIKAIGSHIDTNIIKKLNLNLSENNKIDIDGNGQTSNEKVFSGGDVAGIKSTVSWAARSGRNAALAIINYLENKE